MHKSPFYQGPRPQVTKATNIKIAVGGQVLGFDIAPFALGGRTLAQLRPVAEAMGATVEWHNESQMVTITRGARTARCQVGSEVGVVNGSGYLLDEPPVFVGQHVVVPVRFLAEALGVRVDWNESEQLVKLTRE